MAESTIPNGGLGIFSIFSKEPGDTIGQGDVAIPLMDLEWHSNNVNNNNNPFANYEWSGSAMGMLWEVDSHETVSTYWPGLDAAVNGHTAMANVARAVPQYNDSSYHRAAHPSVGSFSPYQNGSSVVIESIPAGGELFKHYGDNWFQQRSGYDHGDSTPGYYDYPMAQRRLLDTFSRLNLPSAEVEKDLYNNVILGIRDVWKSRASYKMLQALPDVTDAWFEEGKATLKTVLSSRPLAKRNIRNAYQPNVTKPIEWIQSNGVCFDHIRPGHSTISGAGHGAFTLQAFRKGAVVTQSPVVPILDKRILDIFDYKLLEDRYLKSEKLGEQLVKNYCSGFGADSPILLCPYGAGINYINHCNSANEHPNVKLQWATQGSLMHDELWLETPLTEWKNHHNQQPRLVLEYVATRDIQPGDELFLDYGQAWEDAWNHHVQNWSPPEDGNSYRSAYTLNHSPDYHILMTELEAQSKPYPSNLELRCHGGLLYNRHWRYKKLTWEGTPLGQDPEYGHPCFISHRRELASSGDGDDPVEYVYSVIISVVVDQVSGEVEEAVKHNVPRNALRWFDRPHTTDIHLRQAFRHEIGLPKEMLPLAWKAAEITSKDEHVNDIDATRTVLKNNRSQDTAAPACELYLAQSAIPNAGLGMFTAKALGIGDEIGNGDVVVPMIELSKHNDPDGWYFDTTADYVWDGVSMGMGNEVTSGEIHIYWPGINCAVNCYAPLINLEPAAPFYDEAAVHRSEHPGAGAFTPYKGGASHASRFIPAGGELFKDYGDTWFLTRDAFQGIPVVSDYNHAQELLLAFFTLKRSSFDTSKDLYDFIIGDINSIWKSRTLNALPDNHDDATIALQSEISALHQPSVTRDVSWLRENGRCMDHILPGRSTLENAGNGGFAKRFLPKGTIISGSPLHHMFRNLLEMYDGFSDENGKWTQTYLKGHQLLLNYCYGHKDSELLLCPYGAGVNYINHNKTLANVKVQWPSNGTIGHNSSWLSLTPSEIEWNFKPKLAFDFVTTEDVQEGEELFLNYGDEWETAWIQHFNTWEPIDEWSSYASAAYWNEHADEFVLLTESEQEEEPIPDHLSIQCHSTLIGESTLAEGEVFSDWWWDFDWSAQEYGFPCRIVSRNEAEGLAITYDVIVEVTDIPGGVPEQYFRRVVAREGMRFFDRPYTKDMHLQSAFRHEIGIPDDMFPDVWKNRGEEKPLNMYFAQEEQRQYDPKNMFYAQEAMTGKNPKPLQHDYRESLSNEL